MYVPVISAQERFNTRITNIFCPLLVLSPRQSRFVYLFAAALSRKITLANTATLEAIGAIFDRMEVNHATSASRKAALISEIAGVDSSGTTRLPRALDNVKSVA